MHIKGGKTFRDLLDIPADKDTIFQKSGVICRYKCDRVDCEEEYIGESGRTFGARYKEHQKAPSPIYGHYYTTSHTRTIENFTIAGREEPKFSRSIKSSYFHKGL